MTFEWDLEKEKINIEKHNGISFRMASKVFLDRHAIIKYDGQHSSRIAEQEEIDEYYRNYDA